MATDELVGSVAELWRLPVKSMRGEQLPETEVTARGVLSDRAYALIDTDTGRVVSAKSVRLFPDYCSAKFVEPPRTNGEAPAPRDHRKLPGQRAPPQIDRASGGSNKG